MGLGTRTQKGCVQIVTKSVMRPTMLRVKLPYVFIGVKTAHPQTTKKRRKIKIVLSKAEAMRSEHPQQLAAPMEAGDEEADCGVWGRMLLWAEQA